MSTVGRHILYTAPVSTMVICLYLTCLHHTCLNRACLNHTCLKVPATSSQDSGIPKVGPRRVEPSRSLLAVERGQTAACRHVRNSVRCGQRGSLGRVSESTRMCHFYLGSFNGFVRARMLLSILSISLSLPPCVYVCVLLFVSNRRNNYIEKETN